MKTSIQRTVLFIMLFILGSCSTKLSENNSSGIGGIVISDGFKGTGDATLDEGTASALEQVGSVTGMTQWELYKKTDTTSICKFADNFFVSTDRYTITRVRVFDGTDEGVTFEDKIVSMVATEGNLLTTEAFILVDKKGKEIKKQGYTILYTMIPTSSSVWIAEEFQGEEKWKKVPDGIVGITYAIVKETETESSLISVLKDENKYSLEYYDSIDDVLNPTTFKKK